MNLPDVQRALRTYVNANASLPASALEREMGELLLYLMHLARTVEVDLFDAASLSSQKRSVTNGAAPIGDGIFLV